MTDKTEREAIVAWLRDEAGRLFEIADDYITSRTTGRMQGRNIKPELAKAFAGQFKERACAVDIAADAIERGDHLSGKDDV